MSRAAEFCWIAEHKHGLFLMAYSPTSPVVHWTDDPETAIRITSDGRKSVGAHLLKAMFGTVGFRKVLAG